MDHVIFTDLVLVWLAHGRKSETVFLAFAYRWLTWKFHKSRCSVGTGHESEHTTALCV